MTVDDEVLLAPPFRVEEHGRHRQSDEEGLDQTTRLDSLPDESPLEFGNLDVAVLPLLMQDLEGEVGRVGRDLELGRSALGVLVFGGDRFELEIRRPERGAFEFEARVLGRRGGRLGGVGHRPSV